MVCNDAYFLAPLRDDTYLRARGFAANGLRSGGLIEPVLVDLPAGTHLIRLYHDRKRRFGEWWSTLNELSLIIRYFARSGPAFATGRSQGKGILHASLAVRHDWAGNSPDHLGRFVEVRLSEPLKAFHGEGDHAPDSTQTQVQKAIRIIDQSNRQRLVRQIFLPKPWEYQHAFLELHDDDSAALEGAVQRFSGGPLPFER